MDTTQNPTPTRPPQKQRPAQAPAPERKRPPAQKQTPAQGQAPAQKQAQAPKQSAGTARQEPARQASPRQSAAPRQAPAQKRPPQKAPAQKAPAQKKPPQKRRREVPDDLSATRRAYGKTKPKKKTIVDRMSDYFLRLIERNNARKKAKEAALLRGPDRKRQKKQNPMAAPAVIYTQPQAFNRSRFLTQLVTVTAVVLAMVVGLSVFFKVGTITVSGAEVYDPWSVREASGIHEGDNLFTFSRARAGALIKANLPYVKDVRFGIKLPDTVNIIITEEDVVYSVRDQNSQWWLINAQGRVVEQTTTSQAGNHTKVLGISLLDPEPGKPAVAAENVDISVTETTAPAETTQPEETEETAQPDVGVTAAERLTAALKILAALQANGIVGEAASVDVTRTDDIIVWYGTRYQVNLGDDSQLEYKVACMGDVILQMSDYQSGILDISFRIWDDKVVYTPFS